MSEKTILQKDAEIKFSDDKFYISGYLDFSNVMFIYEKSLQEFKKINCPVWEFDFSRLESSNSAGLALIIEWVRLAKQINKPIKFSSISQELMSIAKVMGLYQLIQAPEASIHSN